MNAKGAWIKLPLIFSTLPVTLGWELPPQGEKGRVHTTARRIDQRIRKHRTAAVTLTLTDESDRPVADTAVTVRMTRHKFLFGCLAGRIGQHTNPKLEAAFRKQFTELFNYTTLIFMWDRYEPSPGNTRGMAAWKRKQVKWCMDNGIRISGHPLVWYYRLPKWLDGKSLEQVRRLQRSRIEREVKAFKDLIDIWVVVNETVVTPRHDTWDMTEERFVEGRKKETNLISRLLKTLGPGEFIRQMFESADKANPQATLILNDNFLTDQYEKNISDALAAGAKIDALGLQSHMHKGYWGAERTWLACERFAKFGLPLHFTELSIVSGQLEGRSVPKPWPSTPEGEKRQAEQAVELYRTLYSHPSVEAITWWGFEEPAWKGAPGGLVRRADMSPKPVYKALKKLIKQDWWTGPLTLKTNAKGQVRFRGYLGNYTAKTGTGRAVFSLDQPGQRSISATLAKGSGKQASR